MHRKTYDFSGIKFGVECEKQLGESEAIRRFSADNIAPDYVVTLEFCTDLQKLCRQLEHDNAEWLCKMTRVEAGCPDMPFVCSAFYGEKCRMAALEKYREAFSADSVLRHLPLYHLLLRYGAIVMHASYVLINGEAILFSAPSGVGKSTQAELWKKYRGARIINGDRAIVRRSEKGFTAGGIYYSGTSGYCENITAPLKAIVLLSQAKENTAVRCGGGEAMHRIFRECTCTADFENDAAKIAGIVAELINAVPVYKLDCLPDESAVTALEEVLYGS